MDGLKRERDKNMKNLYSFMNKNKKPIQEKFGLRDSGGNWVSKEVDIKQQLRTQWEKIYNSGCWPNSELQNITTELRLDPDSIHKMEGPIHMFEVDKAINQLHSSTSVGTTDIPPEFLKNLGHRGRQAIFKWCLQIWEQEVFPDQNDMLRTTFLHKKGNTDTLDNYRTLTIGCNICKIYNRMLTNRIQEASEESDILGEIQNGFRPGRRATDNLLVLETVIRKSKRNKLNNFIALLDITKAYDRVNREILWHIMKQMGFPTQLLNNIQQTYHNPRSVVHFQTVKSEPLSMDLGLKQGCVLSPILFAIYIAELGHRLTESGRGVRIGGKIIPGMFFADDMMLIGTETDLKHLLTIVAQYAQEFRLEFAGHKSSVIPLKGPIMENRQWLLGKLNISETESRDIWIQEEPEGRYLGVTIQKNYSIFKPQWELALQKARRGAGLVALLSRRCGNPLTILKPMWQQYVLPAVLYGTEIMDLYSSAVKDLETVQRGLMKTVLRVIPGTATAGCYALTGLMDINNEILKRKLAYYQHVVHMHEDRWCRLAYEEQL
ncbi:MAG: reverse transcriptase family protein, partial [Maribacter sp.]|nr:reverse transcriptase family protein [Maribacter sp.]